MEAFSVSSKAFPGSPSTLVLFLGSRHPDSAEINALFVEWSRTQVVDPAIVIIGEKAKLIEFLQENTRGESVDGLERLTRHSTLRFAGYGGDGILQELTKDGVNSASDLTASFRRAVSERIAQCTQDGDIVIPAPPNFWFEKLSGRYASHFIRAESLLQSTTSIELIALASLAPFHTWWSAQKPSHRARTNIYIDTMGIWPLAEKLAQLHCCEDRGETEYIVESFKSYEGLRTWTPLSRSSFVLVSATTSGGLEERVRERLHPATAHVLTLIKLEPESGKVPDTMASSDVLFYLPRKMSGEPAFNGMRPDFVPAATSLPLGDESIQISGERFLSRHAKPRLVRLVYTALDESMRLALADLAVNQKLSLAKLKFDGANRWSVSFDGEATRKALTSSENGQTSLLAGWLRNYAFPGPVAVVYPAGSGSAARDVPLEAKTLATAATDLLNGYPGTEAIVLSSDELLASSTKERHHLGERGFVVVCPVIGSGFIFKQIAALLRTLQKSGPRLFLTYSALPESAAQFNQLKQDLSRSADDVSYEFRYRYAFPVGRLEQALGWQLELETLSALLDDPEFRRAPRCDPVTRRVEHLKTGASLAGAEVFLPTMSGEPSVLSRGFALWPGSENISGAELAAPVLLTMACLLESTRTANNKTLATTLGKSLFQQALLDPENFTRYNDGVIQAAMLRATYPSELDYRSHPGASNDMARLMSKWIQLASFPIGDAAPEFLLAMATGKLRLCPHHERTVLATAAESLPESWVRALAKVAWLRLGFSAEEWPAVTTH
ncbi:hypothetical protein [Burkholderia cepacia]|uniref:hypothetical protein n=1 Tax=Burkholderia cepacia TaxID=292 RepID=UPI001C931EBA|nr:hypothetical protein [Burkholderia cepacia]MBY4714903.1 hypothetical protein [Burkholderia cepacia]MBY4739010.1 hypothetical protein [Burkholderia cepacia]MBY4744069.1 hypothetical protein [Burkholderia cepacia]MBY4757054.1 hypothetical protein [Burkholderia cepacia]MBY4777076.1 hypothetical protein [Burkholderia cepacia]